MATQNVEVVYSGPFFDGVVEGLVQKYCGEVERVLGEKAYDRVHELLEESIRVNHGVYTSGIRVTPDPRGQVVDDGWGVNNDLPYGLWLEGIGSRNYPVTIFRGYHSFERAAEDIDEQAENVANEILGTYIEEMNA